MISNILCFIIIVVCIYAIYTIVNGIVNYISDIRSDMEWTNKNKLCDTISDIKNKRLENMLIVEYKWFRYLGTKDFSHFFLPLKWNKAMYSLTNGYIIDDVDKIEVMKIDDSFYEWFKRLIYTTNWHKVLWYSGLNYWVF